jgi:hypothetical protein
VENPSRLRSKQISPDTMADIEAVLDGLLDRFIIETSDGTDAGADPQRQLPAALSGLIFALVGKAQERAVALPGVLPSAAVLKLGELAAWAAGASIRYLPVADGRRNLIVLVAALQEGFCHGHQLNAEDRK